MENSDQQVISVPLQVFPDQPSMFRRSLVTLFDGLYLVFACWLVSLPFQNWVLTRSVTFGSDLLSGSVIMELSKTAPFGIHEDQLTQLTLWAAEQGYAVAQRNMGIKLKYGIGTKKQLDESVRWFMKAMQQADVPSIRELGHAYYFGNGVEKDLANAATLYEVAAGAEDSRAECSYGMMLTDGISIRQDYAEALKYMKKSMEKDNSCVVILADFYEKGLAGKQYVSEAVPLYEKAVSERLGGAEFAMIALASMHEEGRGTAKNIEKAIEWYRAADAHSELARLGVATAQKAMWKKVMNSGGVKDEKSSKELLMWLGKAASQDDAESESLLGQLYDKGELVRQDRAIALKWMMKAADHGDANANLWVAKASENGKLLPQDNEAVIRRYCASANAGNLEAQYLLGLKYGSGSGVPRNDIEAYAWLNLAAASGYRDAVQRRDELSKSMTADQVLDAQKIARERQKNSN